MESDCLNALLGFQQRRVWDSACTAQTDYLLSLIVQALRPSTQEWQRRTAVIERLQSVLAGMPDFQPVPGRYGSNYTEECLARVDVFGSFCSLLYHKGSDLDLTITGNWRDRHGHVLDMATMSSADTADMLHRIRRALISRRVAADDPSNPPTVINARVPLVMYVDADSGVAVDISVCNHGGAFKSRFTRELLQFDARFEALYRLVKLWAELRNLNDPKTGTLNSWSITQMVIFHLQSCKPAVLPPLWLFFYNEPTHSPRPLEQQQQQQQSSRDVADLCKKLNVRVNISKLRLPQQQPNRAGAPYEMLQVCTQQRQRYQPVYNKNSGGSGSSSSDGQGLTELLVGFFVRFGEAFTQWRNFARHRDSKMCTWLGCWDRGDSCWRHEYLVCFEDPFDSNDNTARTLGTQSRNDGGCLRLATELQLAAHSCTNIRHSQDINTVFQQLFLTSVQRVMQQDYDPIADLLQHQQRQLGRQQQPLQWQQQQPQLMQQQQQVGVPNGQAVSDLARQMQQWTALGGGFGRALSAPTQQQQQQQPSFELGASLSEPPPQQQQQPPPGFDRGLHCGVLQRVIPNGGLAQQHHQPQQQQQQQHGGYVTGVAISKDADGSLIQARALAEAALTSLRHRPPHAAAQPAAQMW